MIKKMMIVNSMIFMFLNHPITMGSMLIMQTMTISMMMFKTISMSWFSYILFITIIGGMMVMFIYMASIASNNKFKLNKKLIVMFILCIIIMMMKKDIYMLTEEQKMISMKFMMMEKEEIKTVTKFNNMNKNMMTMIMMLILLITMIAITNVTLSHKGPLKKTYV